MSPIIEINDVGRWHSSRGLIAHLDRADSASHRWLRNLVGH